MIASTVPGPQRYRLLALDVDGTLALKDHTVPGEIRAAIRDAATSGATVCLVTGRMRRSALEYAEICAVNGPTVSYQGGIITAADRVTDLHHERLSPAVVESALEVMRESGVHINMYVDDEIWVENRSVWAIDYAKRMRSVLRQATRLDQMLDAGPTMVLGVDEPDAISGLLQTLGGKLGRRAAVTQTLPHFCEVAPVNATKACGLARVCTDLGIPASEVIAVGDGPGDASMLEWAGLGVAAGEAHPGAIAASRLRIGGPAELGVAELIHSLVSAGKLGGHVPGAGNPGNSRERSKS